MRLYLCHRLILALVLAISPALFAGTIPGRYIVELNTEPVAGHVASLGGRTGQITRAPRTAARIRAEQSRMRGEVEQRAARVLDSVDTVANALFVEATEEAAAEMAALPV